MKKYTLVLFVLAFGLSFSINVKPASALTPLQYPYGCSSTQGYSPLTGVKCDSYVNTSLPAGCTSTLGYSPLTGIKCDSPTSNPALPAGCTSTLGYSPLTGVKCDSNGVTPSYPPGCTSNSGYSVTTGQSCAGTTQGPVISGVSGPQTLNVNQQGTWTVTASDPAGGNLSYHVDWGEGNDNPYGLSTNSSTQQSATFTHAYSSVGIRTVTFEVKNNMGKSAQTSLSVNVGNVAPTSSITVLSPNGGETWTKGTFQIISWQSNKVAQYDVSLVPYYQHQASYVIAKNVYSSSSNFQGSYGWTVGNVLDGMGPADGLYTIQVCQTGTTNCDSSDSYFTTTSGTTTTPTVTILYPIQESTYSGMPVSVDWTNSIPYSSSATYSIRLLAMNNVNGYAPGQEIFSITRTSAQSGCSASDRCNYLLALSLPAWSLSGMFTLVVENLQNNAYGSSTFTVSGTTPSSLSITTSSPLPNAKVGTQYKAYLYTSVGFGTHYWSVSSGLLPPGLALTASDDCGITNSSQSNISNCILIYGTPTGSPIGLSTYNFSLTATTGTATTGSQSVSKQFSLLVNPADVVPASYIPTISYLSPSFGVVGSTLTINGNGFTLTGNAVSFGFGYIPDLTSASGNQITFTVPESLNPRCRFSNPPCMIMTALTQLGNYNVSVSNMNGTSNILNFSVVGNVLGATAFHFTQLLKLGSSGSEVLELQKFLNADGYDAGVADGNFGAKTEAAVIKLQIANGLVGDGVVGALTRAVLNK